MKKFLILSLGVFLLTAPAFALDFDFSGNFTYDNDIVLLNFTVGADSNITVFSSSWDDGGFDPILAIWDGSGNLIAQQDDGHNEGSTMSNGVEYTHGVWDSYYDVFLTTGNYYASIGQYNNFAAGSNLSDGFIHDGDPDFTTAFGSQPYFNGVWSDDDPRTSDWVFHLLNVESASQGVPEPATILLLGSGIICLAGLRRKFNK